jgi:membrane fusion protein (multidrug efflux system)
MKLESLPLAPVQPTTRRRRWRLPVLAVLVLALAGGGWAALRAKDAPKGPQGAAKDAAKVTVFELAGSDVATIAARSLAVTLPLSGSLAPLSQATVKSKVSGIVVGDTVREGVAVAAGQVVARLDPADQQARHAQQLAALKEAMARLSLAKKNNANSMALLKQNYISQNQVDTTQNNVELAQANVDGVQAQLEMARIALADTVIRAPLAGVVSKRHVQPGEKVAPDMPVVTIVNLQELTLEAQVPAADIPRIKVGQTVSFTVDGYQDRGFTGTVARINPTTELGSRSMLVYISVANRDGLLRGGMFAKGSIVTEKSAVVPLVPVGAVRQEKFKDKDANVVYTVVQGKVVAQPVTLGLRNDDEGFAEVTSGLAAGTTVLASRLDGVKPGSKVKLAGTAAGAGTAAASAAPAPAAAPAAIAATKG